MERIVIFLPGILGSQLNLGAEEVWPGTFSEYIFGFSEERLNKLLNPAVQPVDIIRNFSIVTQYQAIIDFLGTCGFSETSVPKTLYACPYDWRKSNRISAQTLDQKIRQVVQEHIGGVEITLITHSMGGLLARHYLESGRFNDNPGFTSVKNLYTLAGPHFGAPIAVMKALGLDKTIFLSGAQIKTLSLDPAYPSLYEMFPHKGQPVLWDEYFLRPFDLYQQGARLGLSQANLEAADQFHKSLKPIGTMNTVRYFFFSGTQKTTAVGLLSSNNPVSLQVVDRDDTGDGTVPIWSSLPGSIPTEYVGGEHSMIYTDSQLKQTLKRLLQGGPLLAPQLAPMFAPLMKPPIVITLPEIVLRPKEQISIEVSFSEKLDNMSGNLSIAIASSDLKSFDMVGSAEQIVYKGPPLERLKLDLAAPEKPALYRITFKLDTPSIQSGSAEFFVQAGPKD